jgi:hypothetical protein
MATVVSSVRKQTWLRPCKLSEANGSRWINRGRAARKIGILAKQMIFIGEQISADVAERWGLVNEVRPAMAVSSLRLPISSRSRASCGKTRPADEQNPPKPGKKRVSD